MTASPETLEALAARAGVRFGTSGVRGLVKDLSPEVCRAFTRGFLHASGLSCGAVLIGHDLRPSSPDIMRACAMEARAMGFEPVNAGVVPTPALALAAEARHAPAIMVTGSHIPFDRNGLKFYLPQGEISKEDEARILACTIRLVQGPSATLPAIDPSVLAAYAARYTAAFGDGSLAGLRLGIYEHSSAARDVLHVILRALGAETLSLKRSDAFVPIDTEAVREEDRELGRLWARQHGFDAILTTDGDADRPLIADEGGEWLRGDVLGILCARELGARTVVTPVSSNTALEMSGLFHATVRTRIGSPFVITAMESATEHPVVGYEANGGFLLGSDVTVNGRPLRALKTRDAVLPMILALSAARARTLKLSELVKELPDRHTFSDRLQEVDVEACRALLAMLADNPSAFSRLGESLPPVITIELTDGVRATLQSGDILHLRLSGNAPELRCYAEASSLEAAEALCRGCLTSMSGMMKNPVRS